MKLVAEPELSVVGFRRLGWAAADYARWSARLLRAGTAFVTVNDRDKPLALYVFADNDVIARDVVDRTSSGSVCVNATLFQVSVADLPFGGVGESGIGKSECALDLIVPMVKPGVATNALARFTELLTRARGLVVVQLESTAADRAASARRSSSFYTAAGAIPRTRST